jgi:hypothetical protein
VPSIGELKAQLHETLAQALEARGDEQERMDAKAAQLYRALADAERAEAIGRIGAQNMDLGFEVGASTDADLYGALKAAGYDRRSHPSVTVDFGSVVGTKAATFSGSELVPDYGFAVPQRVGVPPLGADQRFLHPSLVTSSVGADITAVTSFRQVSRSLADPGPDSGDAGMLRGIASTAQKAETSSEAEVATEELLQCATVSSGVPNIMLENQQFRSFISLDLSLAYAAAVDVHCIDQINAASPPDGAPGANLIEGVLNAALAVAGAGYSPSVLAASPEDLLALLLTQQPGSQDYVSTFASQIDLGVRKVAVAGLDQPMVLDPAALGVLYTSPVRFATFEESAGQTNSSTVRIESNVLYLVQRADAVATVQLSGS